MPTIANWNLKQDEFSLILENNPLCDFVELPEDHPNLLYSNIVCGVLRGALEMVCISCRNRYYLCNVYLCVFLWRVVCYLFTECTMLFVIVMMHPPIFLTFSLFLS